MINHQAIGDTAIRPVLKLNNSINVKKIAFTSEELEEPQDSFEKQSSEANDDIVDEAGNDEPEETEPPVDTKMENTPHIASEPGGRKFSVANAAREFCSGFAEPLKQLVKLVENPKGLATAAVGGISIGWVASKVKSFPKYALAATAAISVFNVGKGIINLVKAENVEQRENSFKDMGKGSFYAVTTLLPATNVAKSQKLIADGEKTNVITSLGKVLKSTGDDILGIVKNLDKPDKIRQILGMSTVGAVGTGVADAVQPDSPDADIDLPDINPSKEAKPQETILDVARDLVPENSSVNNWVDAANKTVTDPTHAVQLAAATKNERDSSFNSRKKYA